MEQARRARGSWSTRKKDKAPRGVYRHPSGVWAVRYVCGAGHLHKERVGRLKEDAKETYAARKAKARHEPGWCPQAERGRERDRVRAEMTKEKTRVLFRDYARGYIEWARATGKRSWSKDQSRLNTILPTLGDRWLDEITTADIERFREALLDGRAPATVNRFRDQLSGMFKRAVRLGLVGANPVTGIPKFRESAGRLGYLTSDEEAAVLAALPAPLRPMVTVAVNTGLRWSEQAALTWRDVDMLERVVVVHTSKNGEKRTVPLNAAAVAAFLDAGAGRQRPQDPAEPVFTLSYRHAVRLFSRAVTRAQATLRDAGADAGRLDGFTWHGLRHTFASRLAMAGVDLLSVKQLGGWKTLAMVQRYAHLSPGHLRAAVERIGSGAALSNYPVTIPAAEGATTPQALVYRN